MFFSNEGPRKLVSIRKWYLSAQFGVLAPLREPGCACGLQSLGPESGLHSTISG